MSASKLTGYPKIAWQRELAFRTWANRHQQRRAGRHHVLLSDLDKGGRPDITLAHSLTETAYLAGRRERRRRKEWLLQFRAQEARIEEIQAEYYSQEAEAGAREEQFQGTPTKPIG